MTWHGGDDRALRWTDDTHRVEGATMPAGLSNPVGGYLAFCTIKAVGYTAAAAVISRTYNVPPIYLAIRRVKRQSDPAAKAFVVGPVRTLIGMATGALFFAANRLADASQIAPEALMVFAVLGLITARLFEWWLLVWLFYDRDLLSPRHDWLVVVLGTVWSFVLEHSSGLRILRRRRFLGMLMVANTQQPQSGSPPTRAGRGRLVEWIEVQT